MTNEKIKESILNIYRQGYKVRPHKDWKADLFNEKNSQQDITKYIYDRFKTTTDEVEYYVAMVYLVHRIPDDELFVPYHESPQHLMLLGDEVIDYKSVDDKRVSDHISGINTISAIKTIKVIGE